MTILGYETGEILAKAAMTSDFELVGDIPNQVLVDQMEIERRSMDIRPGMNRKYSPLGYQAATGMQSNGGRYLFDTWENVCDYARFTSEELEFEPGVKFWDRDIFGPVDRHVWKVIGAHDFTPLATTHHVNRFERWTFNGDNPEQLLTRIWPTVRKHAEKHGLAAVWLMYQPDEKQIAILSVACKVEGDQPLDVATRSIDRLAIMPSAEPLLPLDLNVEKIFDRTTPILTMWLPLSRHLHGEPSAYPMSPPFAQPQVAPQRV